MKARRTPKLLRRAWRIIGSCESLLCFLRGGGDVALVLLSLRDAAGSLDGARSRTLARSFARLACSLAAYGASLVASLSEQRSDPPPAEPVQTVFALSLEALSLAAVYQRRAEAAR